MSQVVTSTPFAGFNEIRVTIETDGSISMDRFGSWIQPDEVEKIGLGLIQAAAISRERQRESMDELLSEPNIQSVVTVFDDKSKTAA